MSCIKIANIIKCDMFYGFDTLLILLLFDHIVVDGAACNDARRSKE